MPTFFDAGGWGCGGVYGVLIGRAEIWDGACAVGSDGGSVLSQLRRRRGWVLVQGWSEAYWVQPRKRPGRPWRMTMTPARQDSQTGGVALQERLVQRDEGPEIVTKPRRQAWQWGAR